MNISSGKTIWLRNAALMNDFMEIRYGKQCLVAALQQRLSEIEALLNMNHNGLAAEVLTWLSEVEYTVNSQHYLTSFAENPADAVLGQRSEERRVGKECVSTCSTRGWRY